MWSSKSITRVQAIGIIVSIIIAAIIGGVMYTLTAPKAPLAPKEVLIGSVYPTSGAMARLGQVCEDVVKMAVEEINEAGGIKSLGGAKLRLVTADCKSDPKVAASEAERLITTNPNLMAIVGSYASALSITVSDVCERYQVPYITTSSTDKLTRRGYRFTFQLMCYGQDFGIFMIEFLRQYSLATGKTIKRVANIYEDTAWGTSTAEGVRAHAKRVGFELVVDEAYPAGFSDAAPLLAKVKAAAPDAIVATSYLTDAILIARTKNEMGITAPIIGAAAGWAHQDFAKALGTLAEGFFSGSPSSLLLNPERYPLAIKLHEKYVKRSGEPFMFENAPFGYSAVWCIKEALERHPEAATDRIKLRNAIAELDLEPPHPATVIGSRIKWHLGEEEMEPLYDYQKGVYKHGWGHNIYHEFIMCQWQKGVLYCVWPPEKAYMPPKWPS